MSKECRVNLKNVTGRAAGTTHSGREYKGINNGVNQKRVEFTDKTLDDALDKALKISFELSKELGKTESESWASSPLSW